MSGSHTPEQSRLAAARRRMIDSQLVRRGITDERVLDAMAAVPREGFVSEVSREEAYADRPLPIGRGQTISQPYMVARMLEELQCRPDDVALEIGSGSGYVAALLGELCAEVWAVEIVDDLADRSRAVLADLGYDHVSVTVADGTVGLPEHEPYDRIIVSAGAPEVPEPLVEQLADGGRLVMPVGSRLGQRLATVERHRDDVTQFLGMSCIFVPLVGRHGWSPGG